MKTIADHARPIEREQYSPIYVMWAALSVAGRRRAGRAGGGARIEAVSYRSRRATPSASRRSWASGAAPE